MSVQVGLAALIFLIQSVSGKDHYGVVMQVQILGHDGGARKPTVTDYQGLQPSHHCDLDNTPCSNNTPHQKIQMASS